MKESLVQLHRFNVWANARFLEILRTLTDTQLDQPIVSSFDSIRKTVLHTWGAEDIWLQRLQRVEKPAWKALSFEGTIAQLCDEWEATSKGLLVFTETLSESDLNATIHVVSMKGDHFDDETGAVLQHVVNHSSYHRGQLVTMLRQLGITTIPGTDYIAYVRAQEAKA